MTNSTEHRAQRRYFLFLLIWGLGSVLLVLSLSACSRQERVYKESRIVMDTFTTISVVSPSQEKAKEAIDEGFAEIKNLERLLNYFSPESEITALNKAAGKKPVKVSKETLEIVKNSIYIAKATDGAFNPSIGPLIKLWKFSRQASNHSIPTRNAIENALKLVDYKKIRIDDTTSEIYLEEKGMEIDLGGIAKGYAADKAIEVIKNKGIKSALVAIAGDIKGFGLKPDQQPWKIGIQNPRSGENRSKANRSDIFATFYLKGKAVSTSGDYQRFFMKDGKRYHHIIDPKTGYPTDSDVISASVIAPEGFMSDGLSTAVFVLGTDRGIALLESMGIEGIIVDNNKRIYLTKGLEGKIDITAKEYQVAK